MIKPLLEISVTPRTIVMQIFQSVLILKNRARSVAPEYMLAAPAAFSTPNVAYGVTKFGYRFYNTADIETEI